jgi:hypothetical protein
MTGENTLWVDEMQKKGLMLTQTRVMERLDYGCNLGWWNGRAGHHPV